MFEFRTYKDLINYLNKQVKTAMDDVGLFAEEVAKDSVQKIIYDDNKPNWYTRTNNLKDSLYHTKPYFSGDGVETIIQHDYSKIIPTNRAYGQHHSVVNYYEPQYSNTFVDQIVEFGLSGKIMGLTGEGYWTKPRRYMQSAYKKLRDSKSYIDVMYYALIKLGINSITNKNGGY